MKQFYFRLNQDGIFTYGHDILYLAKPSEKEADIYEVWFKDPTSNKYECVEYHKDLVEESIEDGSWIIQNCEVIKNEAQ